MLSLSRQLSWWPFRCRKRSWSRRVVSSMTAGMMRPTLFWDMGRPSPRAKVGVRSTCSNTPGFSIPAGATEWKNIKKETVRIYCTAHLFICLLQFRDWIVFIRSFNKGVALFSIQGVLWSIEPITNKILRSTMWNRFLLDCFHGISFIMLKTTLASGIFEVLLPSRICALV